MADLSLHRGARPIKLDRERVLLFDNAALWLIYTRYGQFFVRELFNTVPGADGRQLRLKSPDALYFLLWAGLQAEAKERGEELTLEQASTLFPPFDLPRVAGQVVNALLVATQNPAPPGKETAAASPASAAAPARPGPAKVSTSTRRSVSLQASSAGPRRSGGKPRSASTTSPRKATGRK